MSLIYWDTMLFVYWIEGNPQFGPRVQSIRKRIQDRGDRLCTSVFTVGEALAGPRKRNQPHIVDRLLEYFHSNEIETFAFTLATAELYSGIRAQYQVPPADAIHLATASQARVDLFVTNDHQLQKMNVSGIRFISGLEGKVI